MPDVGDTGVDRVRQELATVLLLSTPQVLQNGRVGAVVARVDRAEDHLLSCPRRRRFVGRHRDAAEIDLLLERDDGGHVL
ncbi:hypothetical protein CJ178_30150 [Rhodococcus sp. ACPA4]|nr:hypothetical protein CJ178_30150 [Rhodococcus sp. ACPA4]